MELSQIMEEMKQNRIRFRVNGRAAQKTGATKFGGLPDVPADFQWPYYFGQPVLSDEPAKNRPLSFLAQFNCAELAAYDTDTLLPRTGLLSFFYEEATAEWGFDPSHKGCCRVFYFEETKHLQRAPFPNDLETEYRNPEIGITLKSEISYPDTQDIDLKYGLSDDQYDEYENAFPQEEYDVHQLLGWPLIIQNNMTTQCDLIEMGHSVGSGWSHIPEKDIDRAKQFSLEKWQLLLQLDEIEGENDFYLSFGDAGKLYFYITKEDLKNCNFENVWLIYQCY